ncbi:DUF2207 domain-containing protein [Phycicoccus flavus]|uniref:DUF2207 domain-containing protein n=1 Tax=Phycicoccus flavus TaxID=2502783 RepID=A0A8T6R474_9MICO|nr:DUF2207 domain-containing protein [Phycicoccus flavus]NHA69218.1 DUF2207 domain-containing protein [Phycicoccus flavus]
MTAAGGRPSPAHRRVAPVALVLLVLVSLALAAPSTAAAAPVAGGAVGTAAPDAVGAWGGRTPALAAQEQADVLHTSIEAQEDGSVLVTEDVTWRFPAGEERHGIYRSVRVRAGYRDSDTQYRYYELSGVEVSSPTGAPTDLVVQDFGAFRKIRIGSPSETVSGTARYVVRYRLAHLVNDIGDGTAEVYYDVVDPANGFPQQDVRATVSGPAEVTRAACFTGPSGATDPCPATAGAEATYRIPDLAAEEGASVVAAFPRDAFGDLTPDLREGSASADSGSRVSPAASRVLGTLAVGTGVLLPLLAAAGMGLLVWTRGRDEQYAGLTPGLSPGRGDEVRVVTTGRAPTVAVQFTPPRGVQPGMVGTVLDEEANVVDVSATIVDLAVRGHLTLSREDGGAFRGDDWLLTRTSPPAGAAALASYEQTLLDGIFVAGAAVRLSSLKNRFKPTLELVQREMYEEVVHRGWFRRSPERQRAGWVGLGTVLAGLGVLGFVFGWGLFGGLFSDSVFPVDPSWVLFGGLVVGGLVVRSLGKRMAARTAEGSAVLAQSRGFERYLTTAEANQIRWEEAQDVFSRYLPYAIVLGVADRWASVFEEVATAAAAAGYVVPGPWWYSGPWDRAGFGGVASSMDSFSTVAAGTFVSTPGSSGSSGFSSGGGFSGGGGGGSSGGSW